MEVKLQIGKKNYHSPSFIEHGKAEEILESIENTQPAKRCKNAGTGDEIGFSQFIGPA